MINRRSLFGAGAGAIVATPSVAKGIAAQMSQDASSMKSYGYGNAAEAVVGVARGSSASDYRIERIADLKRLISGEDRPDDKRNREREMMQYLEQVDAARIDGFRSISQGRKAVMMAEGRADRYRRMRVMDAEWELAELQDNLFKFPWQG